MKILLTIHHDLNLDSGAPGITLRLAEAYRRLGHDVDVLGFGELIPARLPQQAKMLGFPWAVAARVSYMERRSQFDVIDASTGDAWLLGRLRQVFPAGLGHALLVTRSHGLEHTMAERRRTEAAAGGEPISWKYPLYHGGYRLWEVAESLVTADVALFGNQHDAAVAVGRLAIPPDRARVVRNGISDSMIGLPPPQSSPRNSRRIAVIGSYIARKGVAHAATALNAWLPRHADWQVDFFGTGVSEAEVLADYDPALHHRLSVMPRYANEDLPRLLESHQIHLFPTLSEGRPLSLIEAMACGLAPVASAVPGVVDAVRDGHDAVLVPPSKPRAIVAALDRLAADRPWLERIRASAYRTAQSHGWSTVAEEQLAIYEEHLERRRHQESAA